MAKDKSITQWYARNVDKYQSKTSHLSLVEHGVYCVLLDHYYKTEAKLPTNEEQIQRICRAIAPHEIEAMRSVISQFFVLTEDGYANATADEEIENRRKLSEKRKSAAKGEQTLIQNVSKPPYKTGSKTEAFAPTATLTTTIKLASYEKCEEEILPSCWQDYAEEKNIPNEQIFKSWRKFKETTAFPYQLDRWRAWIDVERINGKAAYA